MQKLHSASAMADTNMKKKDFARRKSKIVAQNAVAKTHFSVAQNNISVAQSRVDICFFARRTKLFVAQNSVAHVQYSVAQTTHLVAQKKLIRRARVHRYYTLRDDGISVAQKPTCILAPKKSFPRVLTRRFMVSSR